MNNNFKVVVSTSLAELNDLRSYWESHQWHPDSIFDHFQAIVDSRDKVLSPCILSLYDNEQLKCLLIGRIEQTLFPIKIGYTNLFKPRIKSLTISYGGILGEDSSYHCSILLTELVRFLKRGLVDVVYFHFLPTDSNMFRILSRELSFFMRDRCVNSNLHWRMALPKSADEFFKKISPRRRKEFKRICNKFEREQKITLRCFLTKETVGQLCTDAEEIARKTYHRGLGAGFVDNHENRRRLILSAEREWLYAYMLYVEDKPCAYYIGTLYGETLYLDFTGYNAYYKDYEPGTVLFIKMIENLCRDFPKKVREIDFGFGDAFYKQRVADQQWVESSVYLFSPSLKGILLNALYSASCFINGTVKKNLNKLRAYDKIKKIMRNKLQSKPKSD